MNTCLEMAPLLPLAPDEIAEPALAQPLLAHLERCPACRERQSIFAQVRAATARGASRHTAPMALHDRITAALRAQEAAAPVVPAARPTRGPWFALAGGWFAAGAMACALALVLLLGPVPWAVKPGIADIALAGAADAYIDNHARALVTNHVIDVASSDRHTVKPWFRGRLDFSPPVVDLADQGFTLIGGRLDYVQRRNVAVLVYQRRQHVIDVFVWPDAAAHDALVQAGTQGSLGYHSMHGHSAGMAFAAVSDLDVVELGELARDFAAGLKAQTTNGAMQ
jgi:anti-sigma factor RsiW